MNSTRRNAPFGRLPERQLPFSTPLAKLEDLPLEFRKTAARLLEGREHKIKHILFTPEFGTFGEFCPATAFIVTDDEWIAMSAEKSGAPSVRYADFKQTRLIEYSLALLSGHVVLESGESSESSCVLRFNLTSSDLFRAALLDILAPDASGQVGDLAVLPGYVTLNMGMQSSLAEAMLPGDKCVALVSWARADVATGPDRVALQPGGLLLTERYMCLFSAQDPTVAGISGDLSLYDRSVVYLRRDLPIAAGKETHGEIDKLTLTVGDGAYSSSIGVLLPHTKKGELDQLLGMLG